MGRFVTPQQTTRPGQVRAAGKLWRRSEAVSGGLTSAGCFTGGAHCQQLLLLYSFTACVLQYTVEVSLGRLWGVWRQLLCVCEMPSLSGGTCSVLKCNSSIGFTLDTECTSEVHSVSSV